MRGENYRREKVSLEIDEARKRIIGSHSLCKGKGIIEKHELDKNIGIVKTYAKVCKCRKKFDLISRFLLSNVPYENLKNQQIYTKKVTEEITNSILEIRENIVNPYIKNIKKVCRRPYGLLFLGKPGTGKTFIGMKILYYVISNNLTAHYIEFNDFLKLLRKNFDESLDDLIKEIVNVDMLMIDEIGNESKTSDFVIGEFKSLFKRRIENNKPTIMVSNFSYQEFANNYGKSIESVVESHSKILNFDKVPDMRKIKTAMEKDAFFKEIRS